MSSTLEGMLINFIIDTRSSIQLLQISQQEEMGPEFEDNDDSSMLTALSNISEMVNQNRVSYEANMQSATSVTQLRNTARSINGFLIEHPHLLMGCRIQRLRTDFDGESIKKNEEAEWEASCCERFWGAPSRRTLQAINETLIKVRDVHSQANEMLYHLDPESFNSCCCRSACVIS